MSNPLQINIPTNRVFGLDLIRAIAILTVLIRHGDQLIPPPFNYVSYYFMPDGVTIFFVLSGFLIGNILIKAFDHNNNGLKTLLSFWKRRWMRTLPNYYLILSILFLIHIYADETFSFRENWRHIFFWQNIFTDQHTSFFIESWSLSIEEWFYIITPISIVLILNHFKFSEFKTFLICSILIITLSLSFKFFQYLHLQITTLDDWDYYFKKPIIARFDSMMIGVIASCLSVKYEKKWNKYSNHLFIGGILLFIAWKYLSISFTLPINLYSAVFSHLLLSIATALTLPSMSKLQVKKGVFFIIITKISLISYSLYLIHLSIVREWIVKKINWNSINLPTSFLWIMPYLAYLLLSFILAIFLYKYFESPILKLRDQKKN